MNSNYFKKSLIFLGLLLGIVLINHNNVLAQNTVLNNTPGRPETGPCPEQIIPEYNCPKTCTFKFDLEKGTGGLCTSNPEAPQPGAYEVNVSQNIQPLDLSGLKAVTPKYIPKVEIPCNTKIAGGACPTNWRTDLGSYVGRVYQFGLMIAGLLAFGMFIYGAAQYTLSAGNVGSKDDAKETMLNAVYGLVLLFGAYLILYTINPNLVKLGNIKIEVLNLDKFVPQQQIYIPAAGENNTISENPGVSGIPGCLVSVSETGGILGTGIQAGITVESSEGVQSYGTATTTKMLCTKCQEKYTLKDGACIPQ